MNVIWIHGMGESPHLKKIAVMQAHGLTVHALHLDYVKEPRSYEILLDYCKQNKIEVIFGRSHGGFFGFG